MGLRQAVQFGAQEMARQVAGWQQAMPRCEVKLFDNAETTPGPGRQPPGHPPPMMNAITRNPGSSMQAEITEFNALLHQQGVHAALGYLNYRTPHRYTGVWRFDGDILRNEALFDRKLAGVRQGDDAPMAATYCSLVGRTEAPVQILDAAVDPQARGIETPVISYCGTLIRDGQGQAFGTLCHYDLQRCQERTTDQPLLGAAAQLLYEYLHPGDLK